MNQMFQNANQFNHSISRWNVENVRDMGFMFEGATVFNQNISAWNVENVTHFDQMFYGSGLTFNSTLENNLYALNQSSTSEERRTAWQALNWP